MTSKTPVTGGVLVSSSTATSPITTSSRTACRPGGRSDRLRACARGNPLADIGYGLWRSGRPRQDADHLDVPRVGRFLRDYASAVRVSADEASVTPLYLRGRGLQMIAKRIRAGRADTGMLAQVQWLAANGGAISDEFLAALS